MEENYWYYLDEGFHFHEPLDEGFHFHEPLATIPSELSKHLNIKLSNPIFINNLKNYPPISTLEINLDTAINMCEIAEELTILQLTTPISELQFNITSETNLNGIEFLHPLKNLHLNYTAQSNDVIDLSNLSILDSLVDLYLYFVKSSRVIISNMKSLEGLIVYSYGCIIEISIRNCPAMIACVNNINGEIDTDNANIIFANSGNVKIILQSLE
jgi:hypothetical protein